MTRPSGDEGSSALEFVALSVLVIVPVLFLLLSIFRVQAGSFAVTQAAREAGRAYATAGEGDAGPRARVAAGVALADQGLAGVTPELTWALVAPGGHPSCASATQAVPRPVPGSTVLVCVHAVVPLPFADRGPAAAVLPGGIAVDSRYVVPLDLLRSGTLRMNDS